MVKNDCVALFIYLAEPQCSNYNVITMKIKIIDIGNSKGIRIPKALLEQLGIGNEVTLETSTDSLVLKPCRSERLNWAKAFHEMAKSGDDKLLDEYRLSSWDNEEWEWK